MKCGGAWRQEGSEGDIARRKTSDPAVQTLSGISATSECPQRRVNDFRNSEVIPHNHFRSPQKRRLSAVMVLRSSRTSASGLALKLKHALPCMRFFKPGVIFA